MEFSLTDHWALATDIVASVFQKDRFRGKTKKTVGYPPIIQFSASPAIEYNWNNHLGVIAGSWFTFAGKNYYSFAGLVGSATFFYKF